MLILNITFYFADHNLFSESPHPLEIDFKTLLNAHSQLQFLMC